MPRAEDKNNCLKAYRLLVRGTVQGVGFRPFIYRLATRLELKGYVKNVGQGVEIYLEGGSKCLQRFLQALKDDLPPLARMESLDWQEAEPEGRDKFIIDRTTSGKSFVFISPDIATCPECLKEIETPGERRYRYPFTNCTNCGPRYTIVSKLPYDRKSTTMAHFKMCPDCRHEYENPLDRRYHAQPVACPQCGPQLILLEARSRKPENKPLDSAIKLVKEGKILAVKGLGGFHLICDPFNLQAVQRLRKIKQRKVKPLALMARDIKAVSEHGFLRQAERNWLTSTRRPIVLLKKKKDIPGIAPEADTLGFMLPYTPLHHLLLKELRLIVATSSNRKDAPIIKDEAEIGSDLCDFILTHNREIAMRADDSVMSIVRSKPLFSRRARGFVPFPQKVPDSLKSKARILAVGGELKNTISIYKDGYVITSQFLGDLDDYENFGYFLETIRHFKSLFDFKPDLVISDLHPDFRSSSYARSLGLPHYLLQHHFAHVLAPMIEHQIPGGDRVLGISFDGYGYGDDGQAWGGEFLLSDYTGYKRYAHLDYLPLPGGDAAVREPWRMALSFLFKAFGRKYPRLKSLQLIPAGKQEAVIELIEKRMNTSLTSSAGRLFDAVSFLAGLAPEKIEFEAQAPARLEAAASFAAPTARTYSYLFLTDKLPYRLDFSPAIREITEELARGQAPGLIAIKFHNTLARAIVEVSLLARQEAGIDKIILAGGVFLNRILLEKAEYLLNKNGFKVWRPIYYSPGDESLSLGQIAYGLSLTAK
ncbi:MAG: carbamoyltransferase HypF [Acidobacteriota bacterium]|nr:carbamoyltransferase HypF [Acidobacteriota bacterium]